MKLDDFRYARCGKPIGPLLSEQAALLQPIDKRGAGKNHALLLLHGFSSSPAVFRKLITQLPAYDAVVCPVLPGHGDSIAAFTAVKAHEWVATAEQCCAALIEEYQHVDVLGLSLGGLLACHLSQQFKLCHLFLLAPALSLKYNTPYTMLLARILHQLGFHYLRNRAGNLCNPKESELTYRLLPIATIIELFNLVNSLNRAAPECPTDLFLGKYDSVINSASLAERFKPEKQINIHWLNHSAHILTLDNDLPFIVTCIKQHLEPPS